MYSSSLDYWYKKGSKSVMEELIFEVTNIYSERRMNGKTNITTKMYSR